MFFHKVDTDSLNFTFTQEVFDNNYRTGLMKSIDKYVYEKRVKAFRERFDTAFTELKDKGNAEEVGRLFVEDVVSLHAKRGKLNAVAKSDVGLYLIYFVLPTLELLEAEELLQAIVSAWRVASEIPEFNYSSYEAIKEGFGNTILGIPVDIFGKKK